jgi:hypothetical protein
LRLVFELYGDLLEECFLDGLEHCRFGLLPRAGDVVGGRVDEDALAQAAGPRALGGRERSGELLAQPSQGREQQRRVELLGDREGEQEVEHLLGVELKPA